MLAWQELAQNLPVNNHTVPHFHLDSCKYILVVLPGLRIRMDIMINVMEH